MQNWSWSLPEAFLAHPEFENLKAFMERLMQEHGKEISFVVVLGSAAKGNWTMSSNIDVFVGLN